jgi:hypothetical protein
MKRTLVGIMGTPKMPLFSHGAMYDPSPECALKRTSADLSKCVSSRPISTASRSGPYG